MLYSFKDLPREENGKKDDNIHRADAEALQIKGPQREAKGDNKETGCKVYTDQGPAAAEEGDNTDNRCRGNTEQGLVVSFIESSF